MYSHHTPHSHVNTSYATQSPKPFYGFIPMHQKAPLIVEVEEPNHTISENPAHTPSLGTQPSDLIFDTASCFPEDLPTLCTLCCVGRAFYFSTRRLLYRNINAIHSSKKPLFLRSLIKNPALRQCVTSWWFDLDDYDPVPELQAVLQFFQVTKLRFKRRAKSFMRRV